MWLWRAIRIVCGIAALALLPLTLSKIPESMRVFSGWLYDVDLWLWVTFSHPGVALLLFSVVLVTIVFPEGFILVRFLLLGRRQKGFRDEFDNVRGNYRAKFWDSLRVAYAGWKEDKIVPDLIEDFVDNTPYPDGLPVRKGQTFLEWGDAAVKDPPEGTKDMWDFVSLVYLPAKESLATGTKDGLLNEDGHVTLDKARWELARFWNNWGEEKLLRGTVLPVARGHMRDLKVMAYLEAALARQTRQVGPSEKQGLYELGAACFRERVSLRDCAVNVSHWIRRRIGGET